MKKSRPQLGSKRAVSSWNPSVAGLFFSLAIFVSGGTQAHEHKHQPVQGQALHTSEPERLALLQAARRALAAGDSATAIARLDAAAAISHSADTELLMLQAQMQSGDYRGALMFASHTAGAHIHDPEALALYAWMLALGEQRVEAKRMLDVGLQRLPDEPTLSAMRQALPAAEPGAEAESDPLTARIRPGPLAIGADLPAHAQAVGSGLLLDGGRLALVPLAPSQAATQLWLRNGLGHTSAARLVQTFDNLGLALLSLDKPLPTAQSTLSRAPRDAFAGSPATSFAYLATPSAQAAWPAMHRGFLGRISAANNQQAVGVELPIAPRGGPVFDQAGRWIGLVLPNQAGEPQLLPLSVLQAQLGTSFTDVPVLQAGRPIALDQQYEQALPLTLQLLVESKQP
ncbi:serine protease [Paucibacter sp. B2R-40]|uniref:serine protease n=1 Tax=Paucibacter sp. B2R-40 TaxID=2893554 RepID=UPI0021E3A82D|nr:serine protease [Paucibacter sp. B2R-40]MCV2355218.1 serine protease [Paucibacter sp. B2R-40]